MAALQALMQMIQDRVQAARDAASGAADTTSADASGASDAAGDTTNTDLDGYRDAAEMLEEMMRLARLADKAFGAASSNDNAAGAGAQDAMASLTGQLKTDLKAMIDSLQKSLSAGQDAATADAADTASPDATAATPSTDLADAFMPADKSSASITSAPASPPAVVREAVAAADQFLRQMNSIFGGGNAGASFTPANAQGVLAAAGGKSGMALNTDAGGGGGAQSAAAGTTGSASVPVTAEGLKSSSPYSFASQLSASRAANGGTTGLPSAVDQVIMKLSYGVRNGTDRITLQLQPADLGRIDIKLNLSGDGKVQGTVVASSQATLDMLVKDSRSLERALQDAGLSADPGSLQFSLGGQSGHAHSQNGGGFSGDSSSQSADASLSGADVSEAATAGAEETWYVAPGRVNLQV